jgi:methionyl aminopeptidase
MAFKRFKSAAGLFKLQREGEFSVKPHHLIPDFIPKPFYFKTRGQAQYSSTFQGDVVRYDEGSIEKIRKACKIAALALQVGLKAAVSGNSTEDVDKVVHEFIVSQGAYPSGVFYMGFPKSLCTSVNEIVCHGIPNNRKLENGDIVNLDVTAFIDGVYGDNSDMVMIGSSHPPGVKKLVDVSRSAVWQAIKICKPGTPVNMIGKVIEEYVNSHGYAVCKEFIGHGIGTGMHMPPPVIHNINNITTLMEPGMVFTIEPIVMENPKYDLAIWDDNWTITDITGGLSSQYEHTVLITKDGVEVLTDLTQTNSK